MRTGRSGVLVLRGEAGMGKSALLDYAERQSGGCRILHAVGVESEMELPFASLHLLCAPLLPGVKRLPEPQRDALGTAFGLNSGPPPDRFLVGLAVLGLLSGAAEQQPLLCLVDDAQWLDRSSSQVLTFVARRLQMESVVLLIAAREHAEVNELDELPVMPLEGLSLADAQNILASALTGPLDSRVRDRIIAETRGNPLALLELPRTLSVTELAGGFAVSSDSSAPRRIEAGFRRRVLALPAPTQRLLLLAAADPTGDPVLLWSAAHRCGIPAESAGPAEAEGLVRFGTQVAFRHPLLRSAIYGAAPSAARRAAHQALAGVTDPAHDPDRRAWHRAQATIGPDEEVAAELERSADRARTRGGLPAAAAFLQHAVRITPDPAHRAQRAYSAALATFHAGAFDDARRLLATAQAGQLDEFKRAKAQLLQAQIAFARGGGGDAPGLLLAAARRLEPFDPTLARDTYLSAFSAALFVGRFSTKVDVSTVAHAALAAPATLARPADLLLHGYAVVITSGYDAGGPLLKSAVRAFRATAIPAEEAIQWLWTATHAAHDLWDDESWDELCTRHVALARRSGDVAALPLAVSARAGLHVFAGEFSAATALVQEVATVVKATGSQMPPYAAILLAGWQGDESSLRRLTAEAGDEITARGDGMGLSIVHYAKAVLYNSLGRYHEALSAAEDGTAYADELGFYNWALVELVEAATRSGHHARATSALHLLTDRTRPSGTHWARGVEARSRALVSNDDAAEVLYRDAIDQLGRVRMRTELARAHLVYGEWLRREGRRIDARTELRVALQSFSSMGATSFADRAAHELSATGEKVRRSDVEIASDLTSQESQIARYARDGMSNSEIGTRMFLSPRTVEWHLTNVFAKLGINSRRELFGVRTHLGSDTTPA